MRHHVIIATIMAAMLGAALSVLGQQATEMLIPIGQSPGLSGQSTLIGTLESVDLAGRIVTVSGASGSRTVRFTARTFLWVDRSLSRQPNQTGEPSDLQRGRKVEVKFLGSGDQAVAEWIKVQHERAGS